MSSRPFAAHDRSSGSTGGRVCSASRTRHPGRRRLPSALAVGVAQWADLSRGGLAYSARRPARTRATLPDGSTPALATGSRRQRASTERRREAWDARRHARRARRDRHRDREREDRSRSTCRCSTRSPREPKRRALYLYPTKALAQDQVRARSADLKRARASARRSTTATRESRAPLADPQVVEPRSSRTRTCSTSASCRTTTAGGTCSPTSRYVVVDEAHVYRGVFGSHVGNVLRRLRRLAASTAPSRSSCSPRRRSRTPASSRTR